MRTVVITLLLCGTAAFGQGLPDAPSFSRTNPPRTADKAFWLTTGVYGASVAGDAVTRALWVGESSGCPREGFAAGPSGRRLTSARAGVTMAGEFVIASIAGYEFKKHNVHIGKLRLWELPFIARTYAHGRGTINNLTACR